jgi:hypothetical protein
VVSDKKIRRNDELCTSKRTVKNEWHARYICRLIFPIDNEFSLTFFFFLGTTRHFPFSLRDLPYNQARMNAPPLTGIKKLYFWSGAVVPLASAVMYLVSPGGTVQHFNGEVSATSKFWCSVTASGDIAFSYLMFAGIYSKSEEVRRLVIRACWLYSVFHFGAFWYWHTVGDAHKSGLMYPASIVIATAALFAWGK